MRLLEVLLETETVQYKNFSICNLHFFNVYLFLRDRQRQNMNGGGAEKEGNTESEAGSRLPAVSTEPDAGLELTNCETTT